MKTVRLGSAALERIICDPTSTISVENLVPRILDAWSIEFPGLSSLPKYEGEARRLKIVVATEDIVGPVRNGGIGTTYAALAELLAAIGHDSTILYLRGQEVENGTIEQWVEHYAARGVKFIPVPNYAAIDRFQTGADRWLHAPYNMLRWLLDNQVDVVHVSEWHGSGYLSLMAKRQGLAFQNTLFVVKTSSPWMWNRLYGSQPLDRMDDLTKTHAERQSVELADMVIGGSLHLLRWMTSQGYHIPRSRTFVQPNVVVFDHLQGLMKQRASVPGTRIPIEEIVFFGRLEARKGLFIFCQAIKRLIRLKVALPPKISFMGKEGARLTSRPDQSIMEYIRSETADWPVEIQVHTEFQQYDALNYLLSGLRLAVMPSMIENSSLAVYEAAICGIPFIASASGGTPELVAEEDHQHVLCDAHPIPVADHIAAAIAKGGYIAHPSFDNDAILAEWKQFHLDLGRGLATHLQPPQQVAGHSDTRISACIYFANDLADLRRTLVSLKEQEHAPGEILIALDTDDEESGRQVAELAAELQLECKMVEAFDLDAGLAFNLLAEMSTGEFAFFLWAGSTLKPMATLALSKVAQSSNADVINYFYRVVQPKDPDAKDYLCAIIFGSVTQSFFRDDITSLPLLVRREAFFAIGGFTSDYRVLAHDHELVAKAQVAGFKCETALLELGSVPAWDADWLRVRCYDRQISAFRAIRPQLAAAPLALRELLLMGKGLQARPQRRGPVKPAARPAAELDGDGGTFGRLFAAFAAPMPVIDADEPAVQRPKPMPPAKIAAARQLVEAQQLAERNAPAKKKPAPPVKSRPVARSAGLMKLILDEAIDGRPQAAPVNVGDAPRPSGLAIPVVAVESFIEPLHKLSDLPGASYSGLVTAIHDGVAYGWVRNDEKPTERVELEATIDDDPPVTLLAGSPVPLAPGADKDMTRHAFSIPLPGRKTLFGLKLDRRPSRTLHLTIKGSDIVVADLTAWSLDTPIDQIGFDGYCDIAGRAFRGWVWNPADEHAHLDVAVFVDGHYFARTTAMQARDDLAAAGIGHGDHAFMLPIPKALRDGIPRLIEVVVADHGVLLRRGRMTLTGDTLTELVQA